MQVEEHIIALRREGGRLVETVAGADLTAVSPSCPDWTIRELACHQGRVHRWATAYVRGRRLEMMSQQQDEAAWGLMPDDADLVGWLAEGHTDLVAALQSAAEDLACWSFLPAPTPRAFWARRQAHETTIHRVDAQLGLSGVDPIDRELAVDGIDELLLGFFSRRRNQLRLEAPRTLRVAATDADAAWLVEIGPDGARARRADEAADAEMTGTAEQLYLGLWNRGDLHCAGDREVLRVWRDKARVTWS